MKQKTSCRVILIMSERLRVERILNAFETKESRDTVKCEELTQDQDTDSALKQQRSYSQKPLSPLGSKLRYVFSKIPTRKIKFQSRKVCFLIDLQTLRQYLIFTDMDKTVMQERQMQMLNYLLILLYIMRNRRGQKQVGKGDPNTIVTLWEPILKTQSSTSFSKDRLFLDLLLEFPV